MSPKSEDLATQHVPRRAARSSERVGSTSVHQGLAAAIAAAKASSAKLSAAGSQSSGSTTAVERDSKMVSKGYRPEDAIDLLSGDEGDATDSGGGYQNGLVVSEDVVVDDDPSYASTHDEKSQAAWSTNDAAKTPPGLVAKKASFACDASQ